MYGIPSRGGIILVIKNAFYKIKNEAYFVNRVKIDPDGEYRLYCKKAYPVKNSSKEPYYSFNHNSYLIADQENEFFYDFFDHAVFLNGPCLSCEYYDDIDINVLLYPSFGGKDENIRYALCSLRRKMNSGEYGYKQAEQNGERCYTELYCNCEFYEKLPLSTYLKKIVSLKEQDFKLLRTIILQYASLLPEYGVNFTIKEPFYILKNEILNPYQLEYLCKVRDDAHRLFFVDVSFILNTLTDKKYTDTATWILKNQLTVAIYNALETMQTNSIIPEHGKWALFHLTNGKSVFCGSNTMVSTIQKLEDGPMPLY